MREIKFRAWDRVNKKWVDHNQLLDQTKVSATVNLPSTLSMEHPDWEFMQFTGLKDKNGKEIYFGDIIEWELNSRGEKDHCEMREELDTLKGHWTTIPHINSTSEVIGNIYESPELLNKSEEG